MASPKYISSLITTQVEVLPAWVQQTCHQNLLFVSSTVLALAKALRKVQQRSICSCNSTQNIN